MRHEAEALRLLDASLSVITDHPKGTPEEAVVRGGEYSIRLAQVEATLYVGEQLERIADLLTMGYKITKNDDSFGDETRFVEPLGGES